MKHMMWMMLACSVLVLVGTAMARVQATDSPKQELAVVDLTDKTKFVKEILQGKYIFVHDEARMAKGEACFYVYKYATDAAGKPDPRKDNLVLSFHCQHVDHAKAAQIVLTYTMVPDMPDGFEIREVQFAGSAVGHRVPAL